jgi:cell fate regulator YaaT (PSP1 superfamily)
MNDKLHLNSNNILTSFNSLIDENYYSLVLQKISRELKKDCVENTENQTTDSLISETRNILIAKSRGLLGIHFCENINNLPVKLNDDVIIRIDEEFEFAHIVEIGELVNIKCLKMEMKDEKIPIIERIVNEKDIERNINNVINSSEAKKPFLQYVRELSLDMKLVDIHFQFDRKKLYFFYTSEGRVDFRELAKKLAATFKTRIELRQMGVRDEAKRLGGLATCGREYCCTTFINNFKRITTDIAEENNIANSISKYTGPCGKLKCCLSFEIE